MVLHKNLLGLDLHIPKAHTHIEAEITDLNHFDPDAVHTNVDDEIHAAFPIALVALADTDSFIVEVDGGGTWEKARLQWNTIKSLLETQIGGPWLPLTAGAGEPISGDLHLEGDLHLDADQKIYGADGHVMAWYQSLDDSMNFGTNGDIVRLKGSALRPVYEQTPGVDVEIALITDIGAGGGASVLRDGTLGLTADWDAGVYRITTEDLTVNNEILANTIEVHDGTQYRAGISADGTGVKVGDSGVDMNFFGASTRPDYGGAELALRSDIGTDAPASHTHLEGDITDLGSYLEDITSEPLGDLSDVVITSVGDNEVLAYDSGGNWINQTAAEAGLAAASHSHLEADITDLDHDAVKLQGDDVYSGITPSGGDVLAWDSANNRWDAVDPLAANAIFFGSSTTGASVIGGHYVEWQETTGYRKDTGYTHATGTDPDEITLDEIGWYLITVDLGFLDSATDGFTQYTLVVEQWNGVSWADIGNRGGTESGAHTWTRGGADEPDTNFFSATNFFETVAANEKIRIRLQVSSSATTPSAGLDDEKCRIYIERKHG